MRTVEIIARKNGVGIDRDVNLIEETIADTHDVHWTDYREVNSIVANASRRLRLSKPLPSAAVHVLAERIPRHCRHLSGVVVLIPNQERFPKRHLGRLEHVDYVFCKSHHAVDVFSKHAKRVTYLGFTSEDRGCPDIRPDYDRFFHLAGKSTLKGTSVLLELWARHPHWPELTLVQAAANAPKSVPANVKLITEYLSDDELRRMQNTHGIHLCPSLSEGWGHYIVEAMSCRAVVVTTDGPPMNELVTEDRGIVVPWHRSEPRHLGTNWHVNPDRLARSVDDLIARSTSEKESLGKRARDWFDTNDAAFRSRFCGLLNDMNASTRS